jgi:hypothetical protein
VVEDAPTAMPVIMDLLRAENLGVEGIEQYRPTFDEVFVRLVEQAHLEDANRDAEVARV